MTRKDQMNQPPGREGTSPLVLVVDDDPGTRMLAAASLKKAGYVTAEAAHSDGFLLRAGDRPGVPGQGVVNC